MEKKKKKKKSLVPFRVNVLFFVVFLLFSSLVLRLGFLQMVQGEEYKREVDRTEDSTVEYPVPRGKIVDRTGKIVVDNKSINAITYTNRGVSTEEMLEVATRLAKLISVNTDKITERDMQDFWMLKFPEEAEKKVTDAEIKQIEDTVEGKNEQNKKIYKMTLDRITDEDLNRFTEEDLHVLAIFRECNSGYKFTPQIIKKEGVTEKEIALVSENLQMLPGVDTVTEWERVPGFGTTLSTILGKVQEGIPADEKDSYLAKGYQLNDRIGVSYLEKQYEDVLKGEKRKVKYITDRGGKNILGTETISEGQRGKDLVLTTDMELQQEVEKIIVEELTSAKTASNTSLLDRAFVVLMDPHNGDILTMAGKRLAKNEQGQQEIQDFALGNITTSYNPGSAVKGATVLTGLMTGAITTTTPITDTRMYFKDTPEGMGSYANLGTLDPIGALRQSSNVYMFQTTIKIGGGTYVPHASLNISPTIYDTLRNHFNQFGLGTRTGIDLPNESAGFKGINSPELGRALFLSIGQYDTYTPMQLAQYVSTIANGGYRIQPHIVKEIREPSDSNDQLGPVIEEIQPKVLNRLDLQDGWMETVHEGFRQVMQSPSGTARRFFSNKPYHPAGKTGTAEAFYDGPDRSKRNAEVTNISLVAYAPHDNPEIAMAVMVPWAYQGSSGPSVANRIGEKVLDKYFELKNSRPVNSETVQTIDYSKQQPVDDSQE
ncbi:penicillin-binding protein 2 [Bacillaceae bacterium Marseille-Q3522]|nr:penicillin-binding protein 2 [Bacillaceae bacterium Marseille-Q3522]